MKKRIKKLFPLRFTEPAPKGFSLIELLVAIGMFSTFLIMSLDSFWKAADALKRQDQVMGRLRTIQNLINVIGMPSTIRTSAENAGPDSPIKKCILGWPCPADKIQDLVLYLPIVVSDGGSIKTSGAITGPPSAPIQYNFEGVACDPKTTDCPPSLFPLSVSTQFQGVCPPAYDLSSSPAWRDGDPIYPNGLKVPSDICSRAQYIKVFFKITVTPGAPSYLFFESVSGFLMVNAVAVAYPY